MSLSQSMALPQMKWAFTTRNVDRTVASRIIPNTDMGRPGDLICAEVQSIGQHSGVQLAAGRRAEIYPGDFIAVCLGARYAPDQFESEPRIEDGTCHLVAAGGIAGIVTRSHSNMKKPTRLKVHGLLGDASGKVLNIRDFALAAKEPSPKGPVFAVFGSSMNAGKTTTAAALVHGLTKNGFKVGACKATGTGAFGDYFKMLDAGAIKVLDFTDFGYPTTVGASADELREIVAGLIGHLTSDGATAIVVEIADGILQKETAQLARCPSFRSLVDATFFAGTDAMGTISGVHTLTNAGLNVMGASGVISSSPLGSQEVTAHISVPMLTPKDLKRGLALKELLENHGLAAVDTQLREALERSIAA